MDDLNLHAQVAFEFVFAKSTFPAQARQRNYKPGLVLDLLHQALSEPFEAKCSSCGQKCSFELQISKAGSTDKDKWSLEPAKVGPSTLELGSLGERNAQHVHFYGIRVQTRVLDKPLSSALGAAPSCDHVHSISLRDEVRSVLSRLQHFTRLATTGATRQLLFVSPACSLGITVTNEGAGFPLQTVRNLASTMLVFQRQLDHLQHANRIEQVEPLMSNASGVKSYEKSMDRSIDAIQGMPCSTSLSHMLFDFALQGYLDIGKPSEKNSVNVLTFRQAASTFDVATVFAHLDLVTKLVIRSHYVEQSFLIWQLSAEGDWRRSDFNSYNMMRVLGAKSSTIKALLPKNQNLPTLESRLASALDALAREDTLAALALANVNCLIGHTHPRTISDAIKLKVMLGGYGKMTSEEMAGVMEGLDKPPKPTRVKVWRME